MQIISFLCLLSATARGQEEHRFMRYLAVFPISSEDVDASTLEEAWWRMREDFTKGQRFLVAGRKLMESRRVFKPQRDLKVADVVILGRLLQADGIVVTTIMNRQIHFTVFDAAQGFVLWRQTLSLSPYQPLAQQLTGAMSSLVADFISGIPYHGFHILDPESRQWVTEKGRDKVVIVSVGPEVRADLGDRVEWVNIQGPQRDPLFMSSYAVQVFAEGVVTGVGDGRLSVRLERYRDLNRLQNYGLVRLPNEFDRLRAKSALFNTALLAPPGQLLGADVVESSDDHTEGRRKLTALAFIGSLATYLLLAF